MTGQSDLATLGTVAPAMPARPESLWLAAIPFLCMVPLLAGAPVNVPLAGREMAIGPFDGGLAVLVLLVPTWWRRLPPLTVATGAAVAFILWCGLSAALWSLDERRSAMATLVLVQATVVFIICHNALAVSTRPAFLLALRAFGAILSIQIVWVVSHIVSTGDPQEFYRFKNETQVPLGGSNYLAVFLEFCLVYELVRRAPGWLVFAALEAVAIVLTFSRGALVALAGALVLVTVSFLARRGERRGAVVVGALAAIAGLALAAVPRGRLLLQAFSTLTYTAASRAELWSYAWAAAAEAPLTGVGFGAYEVVGGVRDPHGTLFKLLAETGVPGVLLFGILLGGFAAIALRAALRPSAHAERRREGWALCLALSPVLAHSLIEPFFFSRSAFWMAVVLAWMAVLPGSPAFPPDEPPPARGGSDLTAS